MAKEIEVIIDQDGKLNIDLKGFVGKECSSVSEKLLKALGAKVKQTKKKEYYQQKNKIQQKIRTGF